MCALGMLSSMPTCQISSTSPSTAAVNLKKNDDRLSTALANSVRLELAKASSPTVGNSVDHAARAKKANKVRKILNAP